MYHFLHVNYNNSELSIKCIESILITSKSKYDVNIVIIDNNSDAVNQQILRDYIEQKPFNNLHVIFSEINLGYFRALNRCISFISVDYAKDRIIIANNDITFNSEFISILDELQERDDVLVIAPNIIRPDGIHQNPHVISRISKIRRIFYRVYFTNYLFAQLITVFSYLLLFQRRAKDKSGFEKEQYIHMGFGACYILTPNFFKHYTQLDNRVFLMGEEALLANQVVSVSGKTWYYPKLIVYHEDSATFNKIPSKKIYNLTKESYKIYKKYL